MLDSSAPKNFIQIGGDNTFIYTIRQMSPLKYETWFLQYWGAEPVAWR